MVLPGNDLGATPAVSARPLSVLVIDDDLDMANNLKDILEDHGYVEQIAERGADAQAKFSAQAFDLVILDIRLPDMSGPEYRQHSCAQFGIHC